MVKSNCRPSAGGIFRKKVMQVDAWKILRFDTLDSTNTEAKRRAREGDVARTLIIARQQTAGRGRMDRKWVSPMDAGLWMTQLFAPENVRARDASGAVFISAAALSQALRELTGAEVMVKWPNDLVLGGKKICGMLAECGFDGDMCAWIALGSGLNLREDALPPELKFASSIQRQTGRLLTPEEILAAYLPAFDALEHIWEAEGLGPVIERIRPMSATLGREVRVNGEPARALDMDWDGALICEFADGVRRVLAGDVSVRGITDYV